MGRLRAGSFPIDLLVASIILAASAADAPGGWTSWTMLLLVAALAWLAPPPRRDGASGARARSGRRIDPATAPPRPLAGHGAASPLG